MTELTGYLRSDGRKGIRNIVVVAYLVECAHHVAREITLPLREDGVHLIGFPGCYPNIYAHKMMENICTHPNVGAVLLVSLGCESFAREQLTEVIAASGRPVETVVIQECGGTKTTIEQGRSWVEQSRELLNQQVRVPMDVSELVVGTICGGSDATSGLTANPAIGLTFDRLVSEGSTCIFEETGELIGCERHLARRCVTPELGERIVASVKKARVCYDALGQGSFASGNADGELTTQEEKSMGAYAKSGSGAIHGLILPGDVPQQGGLYLLDVVPDGEVQFGFPNIVDNSEIGELIACGCHIILFSTGRGSVVGSAVAPVVKICGNPASYEKLRDDMDRNAGIVLGGQTTLQEVGEQLHALTIETSAGKKTRSEELCHQEFILTYKNFEEIGPGCLPGSPG